MQFFYFCEVKSSAGAIASLVSSGIGALGETGAIGTNTDGSTFAKQNKFGESSWFKATMIASAGLSGGLSSSIAGGNFWAGARQGVIVAGLNHLGHMGFDKGIDPPNKYKKWFSARMKEASALMDDLSDWAGNIGTAGGMTLDWAAGGGASETYFIGGKVAEAMRSSSGITKARNDYYATGKTTGPYTFGLSGLKNAGLNPIQQFVGSYRYNIIPVGNQLFYSLTNTTSFSSAAYHIWPSKWNWSNGPMGNKNQTYIFSEPRR